MPNEKVKPIDAATLDDAVAISSLNELQTAIQHVLEGLAPGSSKARILTTMLRMAERGERALRLRAPGIPPLRLIAAMIELRDLAREEQAWIDGLLARQRLAEQETDPLLFYKAHLVQLETATDISVAYIGSDREGGEEANWWTLRAAHLLIEVLALAPMLAAAPLESSS
jgi:hypothetical protein